MDVQKKINTPLVSIVVVTYNSSKYVIETLESAKSQTYQNIELIITDDCSKDDTIKICADWLEKNKDRFVRTELITTKQNTGIPSNCNRGAKAAKGEWAIVIAGDDLFNDSAIESYIQYSLSNSDISFLHSNVQQFDEKGIIENQIKNNYIINNSSLSPAEQFDILLRSNSIWAGTVFIKTELYIKYGYYIEKYKFWEDRPMWLNLTKNGVKLHYLDLITVKYRRSSDSVQFQKKNNSIFTDFALVREKYYLDYTMYLGFFESKLVLIEYYRKMTLVKLGMNRHNLPCRIINFVTAYPFSRMLGLVQKRVLLKYN